MTEEQLKALLAWIDAKIDDKDRASGLSEMIKLRGVTRDLEKAFNLREFSL